MSTKPPITEGLPLLALAVGLEAQGFPSGGRPADWVVRLTRWLEEIARWNARMDLTAARTAAELVDLMVADAWVLGEQIPPGARVVDVGSGAGAPGLGLALLRPDLTVTLVEPLRKRASFLRTMVGLFPDHRLELLPVRGEALDADAWDVAISRATLPPADWLDLAARLAPTSWALLAKEEPPVIPGLLLEKHVNYTWPCTGAGRRACMYARHP